MRFERRIYDFVELIKIIEDKNIEGGDEEDGEV